jgi:hypothetical protein
MNDLWTKIIDRTPAALRPTVAWLGSVLLGVFVAVVLHYVLYRIGLPSKPFIYVAF